MTRKHLAQAAIALVFFTTNAASADQFAIRIDEPVSGASTRLLDTLNVREIDAVKINGDYYLVLEAKNEGYVEAYIFGQGIDAKGLYRLEADWTGSGLSSLPVEARGAFFEETTCEFCWN
ncbi:hypothetical protein [Marivita sp. XM-24bin2]|jgi:hypothetical protein|uniref:hypothetical protein n=1 Tax=unclassified Marivita TaxID=2632480 RepID=UPI000D7AA5F9|nr:hypothetical protein [Marivita sp. XM-24bin2]MCR9108621.1 hypothetical protein [Paracoccaceae bacterium]PWL33445.1 MAG: hypothetical protein DCO97_19450 [Marivita sp. XM-24bin2]